MRNDRQAALALAQQPSKAKADKIMAQPQSFAFRLAALNAADTNKGKVWH